MGAKSLSDFSVRKEAKIKPNLASAASNLQEGHVVGTSGLISSPLVDVGGQRRGKEKNL